VGCLDDDAKIRRHAGSNCFVEGSDVLTPAQMEDRLENMDRRLDRIEHILPTLATKDDLQAFATKDDLKAFATKEDLREAFEGARSETRALFEDMIDRIKILGEGRSKGRDR
jgi:hypothetical protein